jgi:beta-galactosidase/beta-glucuronidase
MLKWLGANSFRTTHYPYSDQMMDLADRLGFLVIDETPAVGLFFAEDGLARRLQLCLMCLNRYYGWYTESGQLELGVSRLAEEIDAMYAAFHKPLIMTEFGADTIAGHHAQPPEMFSEEYQVELLTRYLDLFKTRPFIVGEHVWNLCDFKTSQAVHRMGGLNLKGVLTRDRRPKLAAHRLRQRWQADEAPA